ncbi:hypothetical protein AVEN_55008-1 [Araneus ventricosus]|uniref:Integrase zinc-binding domain-containing protein n=1 Tax=Araneus ventricosus TaxID=182803 RepID=A0A4Y2LLU7_ARAVE|nr:hypothetical protein AVEN_271627-1 [Araneus ventricosus]GBN15573.1 hypothetical protein AVEN_17816-1 [Araneus ventricosus]GBN15592.1 hypothetical protein AVEN_55008-1 [Araneus ventricosus]
MKLSDRTDLVKRLRACLNCLSEFHVISACNSKRSCFVCKKKHHTLLHKYSTPTTDPKVFPSSELPVASPADMCSVQEVVNNSESNSFLEHSRASFHTNGNCKSVLINSAIIYVKDSQGIRRPLRAILDCASESSFISSNAANVLGLKKQKVNIPICGLNDASININRRISAQISNAKNDSQWDIDFLLVPKISHLSPSKKINVEHWNIPNNVQLADPTFFIPQKVDLLLGAELFFAFLEKDKIKIGNNLFLQSSCFGYLVSGNISDNNLDISTKYCFLTKNLEALNKTLTNFWEIEDVDYQKACNSEELNYCNEHFAKTHFRKANGKYVVSMPLKPEFPEIMLGNSKMIASKRLDQLWTRLERDPTMKALYSDFLNEYESLHHMEEVKEDADLDAGYYLPHHGILRPDNKTTKLRVLFNDSSKTISGYSLNDLLYKGGVLQEDLFSILIRFRKHIYAFTADIKQMFRMIELNESQTKVQKILWKNSKSSPTKVYELRTVTYGTASAPYLATKVLQQLALDEEKNFPLASKVLLQDFYMDDCLSGSSEFTEFETIQSELRQLLQRGGMTLHKWCSSYSPTTAQEFPLDRNSEEIQVKTLGMIWNSVSDTFTYKANVNINHSYTKRDVLSQIARIYDTVGLLGPVISKAKIFMQQLWLLKLDWYEIRPPDISQQWENFIKTLPDLEKIKIPRCFLETNAIRVILHGFADASSKGYGAVIYFQTVPTNEESNCRLLCSKSRVAPTTIMTIPRLELSACLLLSKLTHKVMSALKMEIESVQLWSDSTIALAWINTPPNLLKTFVSNRVSQIQQLTKDFQWKHIPSECNPADLISRGLDVKALAANDLWWKGPDLENLTASTPDSLPVSSFVTDECYSNELKTIPKLTLKLNIDSNFIDNLLDLTNNFHKLIRILAFIFRFITNCKSGVKQRDSLTLEEYGKAEIFLINHFQARYFAPEIACLKKGSSVSQSSKLKFLNPFIDKDGCIRVGGRISYSNVSCNQKHPIILPAGNKLVKLIFQCYHKRDFHVGQQALLNTVRLKYWPLGGRSIARKVVHECVECFKNKPVMANQIMGDLPPERVTPSSPFQNAGLDLCGPFFTNKGQSLAK